MSNWEDAYEQQALEPDDVNDVTYEVEVLRTYEVQAVSAADAVDSVLQGAGEVLDLAVGEVQRIG